VPTSCRPAGDSRLLKRSCTSYLRTSRLASHALDPSMSIDEDSLTFPHHVAPRNNEDLLLARLKDEILLEALRSAWSVLSCRVLLRQARGSRA
jgi:hypothetical protein